MMMMTMRCGATENAEEEKQDLENDGPNRRAGKQLEGCK